MRSIPVTAGQQATATQYNNLQKDAYASSWLLSHQQSTPGMTLYVEPGNYYINGTVVAFAGGSSPTITAPVSNPRIDVLSIDPSGTLVIYGGNESASPVPPAYPSENMIICQIYNRVGETKILDANDSINGYILYDARPFLERWHPFFGDGSDGNVTISTPTTLTRDMYYNNLSVTSILITAGFRIFVKGTLNNSSGGLIKNDGNAGSNGGNMGSFTAGGAGATANVGYFSNSPGTAGGQGSNTGTGYGGGAAPASAAQGALAKNSNSNTGGAGGTSSGTAGGAGGTMGTATGVTTTVGILRSLTTMGIDILPSGATAKILAGMGGTGGGGGSGGNNGGVSGCGGSGGGGGASGGVLFIAACNMSGSGGSVALEAIGGNGGNGGNGTGTAGSGGGGGGGGNGGCIIVLYETLSWAGSTNAAGGTGGTGGIHTGTSPNGNNGNNGSYGLVVIAKASNLL